MSGYSSSAGAGGGFADSLVWSLLLLIIFLILVGLFLLFQAMRLIITTFVRYPHSVSLWIALFVVCGCAAFVGVSYLMPLETFWIQTAWTMFDLSFITLVLTAWVVKTYNTELSHPEQEHIITRVLQRPWWPKSEQLAQEQELAQAA